MSFALTTFYHRKSVAYIYKCSTVAIFNNTKLKLLFLDPRRALINDFVKLCRVRDPDPYNTFSIKFYQNHKTDYNKS